jgi:hypothetical protein
MGYYTRLLFLIHLEVTSFFLKPKKLLHLSGEKKAIKSFGSGILARGRDTHHYILVSVYTLDCSFFF